MVTPFPMNTPLQFYGVDNHRFKLGDVVYEAVEDPDDGYRSCLGSVVVSDPSGIFFHAPLATVRVVESQDLDGFAVVDDAGHQWLVFGTDHADEWYPMFVFAYEPLRTPAESSSS